MFVDYAGQTVELFDGRTGEIRAAQVFVAVMGASSYTYAEAPARAGSFFGAQLWILSKSRIDGSSPFWDIGRHHPNRLKGWRAAMIPNGTYRQYAAVIGPASPPRPR